MAREQCFHTLISNGYRKCLVPASWGKQELWIFLLISWCVCPHWDGGSCQTSNIVNIEFYFTRSFKNFCSKRSTEFQNLEVALQRTFEISATDHGPIILLIIWMSTYSSAAFLREFFQSISSDIVVTIGIPIYKPREYPLQKDENRWGDIANCFSRIGFWCRRCNLRWHCVSPSQLCNTTCPYYYNYAKFTLALVVQSLTIFEETGSCEQISLDPKGGSQRLGISLRPSLKFNKKKI